MGDEGGNVGIKWQEESFLDEVKEKMDWVKEDSQAMEDVGQVQEQVGKEQEEKEVDTWSQSSPSTEHWN